MSQKPISLRHTAGGDTGDRFTGHFLPEGFAEALGRYGFRAAALFLAGAGCALVLALMSYHWQDPSFNQASDLAPHNWLGRPGAQAADITLQMGGAAAALLPLLFFAWAWRLFTTYTWSGWRLVFSLPAVVFLAAALAALPVPEMWPLATGMGGILGALSLNLLGDLVTLVLPETLISPVVISTILALLALIAGVATAVAALGLSRDEWRILARRSARMSLLVLRAGTQLSRWLFTGSLALLAPVFAQARGRRQRHEPLLHADAEPLIRTDIELTQTEPADDLSEREPLAAPLVIDSRPQAKEAKQATKKAKKISLDAMDVRQGQLDFDGDESYCPPGLDLLAQARGDDLVPASSEEELFAQARQLESVLQDYGVKGQIIKVHPGPVVTLFELEPAPGTKTNRVISLSDDIARSMSAISVRIATVPGRNVIGIELPNKTRESVYLSDLLADPCMRNQTGLFLAIGKDIGGAPVAADLARMPHLLIAGTTGSGKSVGINAMILSLLYRLTPEQCRLILIDPKMLELSVYDDIPHLLTPVVTDPQKAVVALKWTVKEMERRYADMVRLGVRNITGYNQRVKEAEAKGEHLTRVVQTGFDPETGRPVYEEQILDLKPMPSIVVIVDEMADLMMVAGKEIEIAIQRLAQMARAAGIHIIMATQRPSVDVITGTIKANFPVRISFQVTSKIDSRTILGEQGAEQLLGQGDMLFTLSGGRIRRVHGPFVSDSEVERVVYHLKQQGVPDYLDAILDDPEGDDGAMEGAGAAGAGSGDILYDRAIDLVARNQKASTSFLQRHLQIGYNRAATLIERMEDDGIVGAANHVGKREVFVRRPDEEL